MYDIIIFGANLGEEIFEITTIRLCQRSLVMSAFKEIYLVLEVVRTVVLWCGREQADIRINTSISTYLRNKIIKGCVHCSTTIAELVTFVNENQTIVLMFKFFFKIACVVIVIICIFFYRHTVI